MTPLTDDDIETIARRYCEAMGWDPDRGYNACVVHWERVAIEVRDRLAWKIALQWFGEPHESNDD